MRGCLFVWLVVLQARGGEEEHDTDCDHLGDCIDCCDMGECVPQEDGTGCKFCGLGHDKTATTKALMEAANGGPWQRPTTAIDKACNQTKAELAKTSKIAQTVPDRWPYRPHTPVWMDKVNAGYGECECGARIDEEDEDLCNKCSQAYWDEFEAKRAKVAGEPRCNFCDFGELTEIKIDSYGRMACTSCGDTNTCEACGAEIKERGANCCDDCT